MGEKLKYHSHNFLIETIKVKKRLKIEFSSSSSVTESPKRVHKIFPYSKEKLQGPTPNYLKDLAPKNQNLMMGDGQILKGSENLKNTKNLGGDHSQKSQIPQNTSLIHASNEEGNFKGSFGKFANKKVTKEKFFLYLKFGDKCEGLKLNFLAFYFLNFCLDDKYKFFYL